MCIPKVDQNGLATYNRYMNIPTTFSAFHHCIMGYTNHKFMRYMRILWYAKVLSFMVNIDIFMSVNEMAVTPF